MYLSFEMVRAGSVPNVQQYQFRCLLCHRTPERRRQPEPLCLHAGAAQRIDHQLPDAIIVFYQINHIAALSLMQSLRRTLRQPCRGTGMHSELQIKRGNVTAMFPLDVFYRLYRTIFPTIRQGWFCSFCFAYGLRLEVFSTRFCGEIFGSTDRKTSCRERVSSPV